MVISLVLSKSKACFKNTFVYIILLRNVLLRYASLCNCILRIVLLRNSIQRNSICNEDK